MKITTAPNQRRRRLAAVASTCALATALAACGSSDSSGSNSSSGSADSDGLAHAKKSFATYEAGYPFADIPAIDDLPDLTGKTVWYIPMTTRVSIPVEIGQAAEAALSKLGATVKVCDGGGVPTTVAACMDDAVSQDAAAVITGYVPYEIVPNGFEKLVKAGIPVAAYGVAAPENRAADDRITFVNTSEAFDIIGQVSADAVIADSSGQGNIVMVGITDTPSSEAITAAAKKEIETYCSGCELTIVETSTAQLQKLASATSAALVSNPQADYLLTFSDSLLSQIKSGIQSAGFTNKVKIISVGSDLTTLKAVKAGTQVASLGSNTVYEGWVAADALLRLLAGAPAPDLSGAEGKRLFTEKTVEDLDLTAAARETGEWYGELSWQDDFVTAWNGR